MTSKASKTLALRSASLGQQDNAGGFFWKNPTALLNIELILVAHD